jgi:hypothetical protein
VESALFFLRSTSPMTVCHEAAHALDYALVGGVYLSGFDPRVRRTFREARAFDTPYAAAGLDEFSGVTLSADRRTLEMARGDVRLGDGQGTARRAGLPNLMISLGTPRSEVGLGFSESARRSLDSKPVTARTGVRTSNRATALLFVRTLITLGRTAYRSMLIGR